MTVKPEKVDLSDVKTRRVDESLIEELRDLFARAEDQKERYDFTWNGKAKSYFEAATPSTKTLRPQPEESYIYTDDQYTEKLNTFNDSENLFITGDNLDALKLLQESYLNKIDVIYIDPPYNTGKDFVYHDNFKQTQKEADVAEGNIDNEGNRLVKNDKSSGRYHSDWLSMMYPRLKLARNLLSDTGVIFVSIDDNEQANLKLLMDEVFGEDNFVSNIIWKKKVFDNNEYIPALHDYLLVYSKNKAVINFNLLPRNEQQLAQYKFDDYDGRGKYKFEKLTAPTSGGRYSQATDFKIIDPISKKEYRSNTGNWRFGKNTIDNLISIGDINFEGTLPRYKLFLNKVKDGVSANSFWDDTEKNLNAAKQILDLFGKKVFETPKPVGLIEKILKISTKSDSIILDFFAGSATSADAVMKINNEDGGNRKFILATLDEKTPINSEAYTEGYNTIDQISRERIRRAAAKYGDISGFRALNISETWIDSDTYKTAGDTTQAQLLDLVDKNRAAQTDFDLLYEVLVDGALEYNRKIEKLIIEDEEVIAYDYFGELSGVLAYFGDHLTDDLTRQIAKKQPLIAVFREATFEKSAQKVNVLEQFRILSPDTKVKVI